MIIAGDCRTVMQTMDEESVDAIVTDPPYGLEFMGKGWDHGVPGVPFWSEALRVLKPGGHLLAFGGTRTFHRLTVAIEDAGFEIRDCLSWLYGQGFPKSLDVSKAIDKMAGAEREVVGERVRLGDKRAYTADMDKTYHGNFGESGRMASITAPATPEASQWAGFGTALKPSWEPVIVARKPLIGTVAANVLQHGTGALNIDGTRIGTSKDVPASPRKAQDRIYGRYEAQDGTESGHNPDIGRWPANVVLDEAAAMLLDEMSGERGNNYRANPRRGEWAGTDGKRAYGAGIGGYEPGQERGGYSDSGGASRFFYVALPDDASCPDCEARKSETDTPCFVHRLTVPLDDPEAEVTRFAYVAKASRRERNAGLEGMPERDITRVGQTEWTNRCQSCGASRPQSEATCGRCGGEVAREDRAAPVHANGHPTVKPIALMRWLVRLVTPPGGLILDPFAGSGSTGCAAVLEGVRFVGIEQDAEYAEIAERRIAFWRENGDRPVRAASAVGNTNTYGHAKGRKVQVCPVCDRRWHSGAKACERCGGPLEWRDEQAERDRRPTILQPALPLEGAAD